MIALLVVLGFGLWIAALVHAARSARWTWFVLMLVIWPVALFYPLALRERRRSSDWQRKRDARRERRQMDLASQVSELRRELDEVRARGGS